MVWGSTGDEVRGWCTVGSQSMSFSHFICLVFVQGAGASPSVAFRSELPARSWHSLVGGDGGWETHLGQELALRECASSCTEAAPQPGSRPSAGCMLDSHQSCMPSAGRQQQQMVRSGWAGGICN